MSIVQMVLPLIGVVIGALGSYLAASAGERSRWRRHQRERWDARRIEAYIEYGHTMRNFYELSKRIAATRGFKTRAEPLSAEEGMAELISMGIDLSAKWEAVLLLGNAETIAVAREWQNSVWTMARAARGDAVEPAKWERALHEFAAARDQFYEAARSDLGIFGAETSIAPSFWNLADQPRGATSADAITQTGSAGQ